MPETENASPEELLGATNTVPPETKAPAVVQEPDATPTEGLSTVQTDAAPVPEIPAVDAADHATLDLTTEATPDRQLATKLTEDPRYLEIIQELTEEWEKKNGSPWVRSGAGFNLRIDFLEWKEGSATIRAAGEQPDTLDSRAEALFRKRYSEDATEYDQRERVRVYAHPSQDPAWNRMHEMITRQTNLNTNMRNFVSGNGQSLKQVWMAANYRATMAAYNTFAREYPEKAAGYATNDPLMANALALFQERQAETQPVAINQLVLTPVDAGAAEAPSELLVGTQHAGAFGDTVTPVLDTNNPDATSAQSTDEAEAVPAETREQEMIKIHDALTTALGELVNNDLLTPEETKTIAEKVSKAGTENPSLTSGDLRVEALVAVRGVINSRPDQQKRMIKWDASTYQDFIKAETSALNQVFGEKTHDARLGIVYPDGHVVRPVEDFKAWEKEVKKLQKVDDESVRFGSSTGTDAAEEVDTIDPALAKELHGATDAAKVMSLMGEEQWGMARKLFKNEAPKAMSLLAKIVSEKGLPTTEAESLALRLDLVNDISGFKGDTDDILMDVHEVISAPLASTDIARYVEMTPITREQILLTQWLDSIFGSTDTLLVRADKSQILLAKEVPDGQENENVRHFLRVLRGMRRTMLGFGSSAATLVDFHDSLLSKARSLPKSWKPGAPQPFEVINNITPEEAAQLMATADPQSGENAEEMMNTVNPALDKGAADMMKVVRE